MRASEMREMNQQERADSLDDLVEEYRGLRFGHVMQQVSNPMRLRDVRRDIARLKTIIAQEATGPSDVEPTTPEGDEA